MTILPPDCTSGGCGAKIAPGLLGDLIGDLRGADDPDLLVGFASADDAAAYRLDGDTVLLSTADFFPPMIEDAFAFGGIAAANALSDIYAMGGTPLFALNLVCFPERGDPRALRDMLEGGAHALREAGVALAGGHSIHGSDIKYGLSVTGRTTPDRLWRNDAAHIGDRLILTKPLGVGLVLSAQRAGLCDAAHCDAALRSMRRLNRYAAQALEGMPVHACTDVTGFGLLVHAKEMAGADRTVRIDAAALPSLPGALRYASEYLMTAAGQRNREHMEPMLDAAELGAIDAALQELMFDPQTSGGLLVSVPEDRAEAALAAVRSVEPTAAIVGSVEARGRAAVRVAGEAGAVSR